MSVAASVKALGLLQGRGRQTTLLRLCHAGRLVGGLSVSLRALPDEVVGALTHAMGGGAKALRVLDVRSGPPMMVEIGAGAVREKWEVADVEALVHNLNDLFRDDATVRLIVVLGEWEDMLQLWCVERSVLERALAGRLLDDARNVVPLRRALEPASPADAW